jgi:hypothetical protein
VCRSPAEQGRSQRKDGKANRQRLVAGEGQQRSPDGAPTGRPEVEQEPFNVMVVPAPLGVSAVSKAAMATPSMPIISDAPVIRVIEPGVPTRAEKARAISSAVAT